MSHIEKWYWVSENGQRENILDLKCFRKIYLSICTHAISSNIWRKLSLLSLKIGRRSNIAFGPALLALFHRWTPPLFVGFRTGLSLTRTNDKFNEERFPHLSYYSFVCMFGKLYENEKKWWKIQSSEHSLISGKFGWFRIRILTITLSCDFEYIQIFSTIIFNRNYVDSIIFMNVWKKYKN